MKQRTWRDLTWREWVVPPPDGTIPWHPLWDTLRAIFCVGLVVVGIGGMFASYPFWEVVTILVVFIIGLGACLA